MRAGGCTVQQALTAEAASVVKQAVNLARRRGHAQVTPLHVANTMLSASAGLLRTACLQSRSHPLQCRALELCFNVALNRLPASTSSNPMLGSHHQHHHQPSISNALVAAFKRAQAHQRRGSIESQQQPLLAVKIELEQLIISILDDPSVSRVMREAGFSSTQVKTNVEQAVSLETCNNNSASQTIESSEPTRIKDDVAFVLDSMVAKPKTYKSCAIVGETLGAAEGVARGLIEKIEKGEVPEVLRGVKFVNLSVSAFARLEREHAEQKLEELKRAIKSYAVTCGVVLFLGDLKWTAEYRSNSGSADRRINYYCPVEHAVIEIEKLVSKTGESEKFWLMGIATFQTYKACKSGHLSLESVWGLNPITIPSGSLRLSLIPDSDKQSQYSSKKGENGCSWVQVDQLESQDEEEEEKQLKCCGECSAKFDSEARSLRNHSSSTLPAWLQHYKNQNKPPTTDQDCVSIKELRKKWNSICSSIHKQHYSSEKALTFSPTSNFSYHHNIPNQYPILHRNKSWPQHNHFWLTSETAAVPEPPITLKMYLPEHDSNPNSASSSDVMEVEYVPRFKDLNAENLKTLCDALERKTPSHAHIVPDIATAILRCRSGLARRKEKHPIAAQKEDTWLFFEGPDVAAKETVARELARLVFGSRSSFASIALSSFSSSTSDNHDFCRNKRSRDERSCSYIERFAEAVAENAHRVFFVEDVEQADWCSQVGFKRAVERGRVTCSSGERVVLGDAIVVLSCERFRSRSRACSPRGLSEGGGEEGGNTASLSDQSPCVSLDLNMSIDEESVEECDYDECVDDIGLPESVDARVIFKFQDL